MKISQITLKEKAAYYIENGLLTKNRGVGILYNTQAELDRKRKEEELLSDYEINLLKMQQNTVIENENSIEFYNFTGAAAKFNTNNVR